MDKKYIDELCKVYNNGDFKELTYLVCCYKKKTLQDFFVQEEWLLNEIGKNLNKDELNYVLSFLKSKNESETKFATNVLNNMYTLNTENKTYIKECVKEASKNNISSECVTKLINIVNDVSFCRECIRNARNLNLNSKDIYQLITSTNDIVFMKECINNHEHIGLFKDEIYKLINNIEKIEINNKFTIWCINNYKALNLNSKDIKMLLMDTEKNDDFYKCINNWKEYNLKPEEIVFLLIRTKSQKNIKNIIEKSDEFKFNIKNMYDLIMMIDDEKYLIKKVKQGILDNLDSKQMASIIYRTKNIKFINYCIKKCDNLKDSELNLLKDLCKQLKFAKMNKRESKEIIKKFAQTYNRRLELPDDMTIGLEIECVGRLEKKYVKRMLKKIGNWNCKYDDSIEYNFPFEEGIELTSPILQGHAENEIRNICGLLNYFKQYINRTCGGHIHIGGGYLKSIDAYKNLLELWSNTEKILYIISNEDGSIPRKNIDIYAKPISKELQTIMESGTVNICNESDLASFKEKLKNFQQIRYKGINFINVAPEVVRINNLNTIEFRIPNGTINADVWIDNINLFGGMIAISEKISKIQNNNTILNTNDIKILNEFNSLKSYNLTDEEKLDILLNLTVSKEAKGIYISRYINNKKRLQKDAYLSKYLNDNTADKSISIPRAHNNRDLKLNDNNMGEKTHAR